MKNKLPTLKAQPLSLHSINSSKIPTMLGNSTKPSLADGLKKEDEKRKRKVLRNLRSKAYFCRDYLYSLQKKEKADFIRRSVFLLVDFRRGNLGRVRLAITILFSRIGVKLVEILCLPYRYIKSITAKIYILNWNKCQKLGLLFIKYFKSLTEMDF